MLTKVFLLAVASPAVSLRVADTVPIVTAETLPENTLALSLGALTQAQPSPQNVIHVEIDGLRNNKGQVL